MNHAKPKRLKNDRKRVKIGISIIFFIIFIICIAYLIYSNYSKNKDIDAKKAPI